jgi:undecaprenyl-diphosphatase
VDPDVAGSSPVGRPIVYTPTMNLFEALIFGILQGLTEFLPISSSAHVILANLFFHVESSESQVLFDLICHLGTLLALLFFLRKEILNILRYDRQKMLLLFVALIPLIPCYFLLKPLREWMSAPHYLGFCLIITSFILFLSQKYQLRKTPPETKSQYIQSSLLIGAMQSAALIPGISRSASTICCAKFLGWSATDAVRFSFLLSIPTIIGGNCLELLKIYLSHETPANLSVSACMLGFVSSLGCGLLVVRFAISYLEKGNLKPFAWYCLSFGILVSLCLNL